MRWNTFTRLAAVVAGLTAASAGCTEAAVGDPCTPARPPRVDGGPGCGPGGTSGCLTGNEIYIEATSLQCRTRVCLSYRWDEVTMPNEANARSFCTCRCDGDPATRCICPDGFVCEPIFTELGAPGIRGSYCVRQSILPPAPVRPSP